MEKLTIKLEELGIKWGSNGLIIRTMIACGAACDNEMVLEFFQSQWLQNMDELKRSWLQLQVYEV